MDKEKLLELMDETRRRQRLKTDLGEFDEQIKEMMDLNISLPVVLGWLEKQKKTTTLPALRRYVKRVFGDAFYDDFLRRNGWLKTKAAEPNKSKTTITTPASSAPDGADDAAPVNRAAPTTPTTLAEMKKSSRDFDIDPSKFD